MDRAKLTKTEIIDEWFSVPDWREIAEHHKPENDGAQSGRTFLIVRDSKQGTWLERFCDELGKSQLVIEAVFADHGIELKGPSACFAFDCFEDLWMAARNDFTFTDIIVAPLSDLEPVAPPSADIDEKLAYYELIKQSGFYRLIDIVRAIASVGDTTPLRMVQLLSDVFHVTESDQIDPFKAMLVPCTKVVSQEFPFLACRNLEVRAQEIDCEPRSLAAAVLEVLAASGRSVVSIRAGRRLEQVYRSTPIALAPLDPIELQPGGCYLITGGRGRIGFTLARHLAEKYRGNLVLTGISPVPPRTEWDAIINDPNNNTEWAGELLKVRELEAFGCKVMLAACDASDLEATMALVRRAEEEFGVVRGVIHAAGIFEAQRAFRGILDTTKEDCERRFLPKIEGSLVIHHALAGRQLDFAYMQSSLSAVLGGFGFLAYSSGNAFMDSYAEAVRTSEQPWMSINWDGWVFEERENRPAASVISAKFASPDFGVVADIAIKPLEGAECLERLLQSGKLGQVLVSTASLSDRLSQWVDRSNLQLPSQDDHAVPRSETEPKDVIAGICEVFSSVLGIEGIGPADDFFELGGDSLAGIQLVSELSTRFQHNFDVIALLEQPVPGKIAAQLEAATLAAAR